MKLLRTFSRELGSKTRPELPSSGSSGVALVITLILLSVITFLAITFLAIARREKGSVTVSTELRMGTLAAEHGQQRAIAEVVAGIMASGNPFNFDLVVSTNFVNWAGFDPGALPSPSGNPSNVNYFQTRSGAPLSANQMLENLHNLLYDARPPVFITNRLAANSQDFRFYLDLNRNGRYDTNGYWPVVSDNLALPYYRTNGVLIAAPLAGVTLSNHFTGDPEFIGVLERPEFPHSPTNRFLYRFAYIVVPAGKTLDLNYIHNHAKLNVSPLNEGFFRNMGVGPWENNLAGFLRDLNTNAWGTYNYRTNAGVSSTGVAFDDARSFALYRAQAGSLPPKALPASMTSVQGMFGANGVGAFRSDYYDGYTAGPLLTDYRGWNYQVTVDQDSPRTAQRWPGAYNPEHFFTTQDLFDGGKTGYLPLGGFNFVDRLHLAQTNSRSTYDTYTFYRMLAQLGTDSAPDPDDKLNLNYINLPPFSSTDFVPWNSNVVNRVLGRPGSELFFTNAVDRLLRRYTAEWRDRAPQQYFEMFGTTNAFGAGNIPVLVNGRFAYTPSVHRVLQLAANIWDATNPTNHVNPAFGPDPTVFRPVFRVVGNNVYIRDFFEDARFDPAVDLSPQPLDLGFTNAISTLVGNPTRLVFGVPLIIGARKGLPNFNEFASENIVQITRKIELVKSGPGGGNRIVQTNQFFTIGISNAFGAEFWHAYANSNYTRPVEIRVINYSLAALTNDFGYSYFARLDADGQTFTNDWKRWNPKQQKDASLIVPLRTNHVLVADMVAAQDHRTFVGKTIPSGVTTPSTPVPLAIAKWGLTITNRVVGYVRDRGTGRLLDYVQLNGMVAHREITREMAQLPNAIGFDGLWSTNSPNGIHLSGRPGIINQIQISLGDIASGPADWQDYGIDQPVNRTKDYEIAMFKAFFSPDNKATYGGFSVVNTNLKAFAPFTPTWKQSLPMLWQANDPLIHYTSGDMEYLERSQIPTKWKPASSTNAPTLNNLGLVNERYKPWGGNPFQTFGGTSTDADKFAFYTTFKDPGVRGASDWEFLTNKLATLGWLGRVHRGSPWQTVYLKSPPATNMVDWQQWTGNRYRWNTNGSGAAAADDALFTVPEADRAIFDVFTTALHENASRGQLPINQTNLAAWSAVFSGMVALTNSSTVDELNDGLRRYDPWIIDPAGIYNPFNTNAAPAVVKIVEGINRTRANTNLFKQATFTRLGDLLAVPELTTASPFLNQGAVDEWGSGGIELQQGMNDPVMEWLPQQMMSLVRLGEPRFVVYSYGQGLKPAPNGTLLSGAYQGMVTNYQITAEVVTRSVVRIEGAPDKPRAIIESYNVLPPD